MLMVNITRSSHDFKLINSWHVTSDFSKEILEQELEEFEEVVKEIFSKGGESRMGEVKDEMVSLEEICGNYLRLLYFI